MIHIQKDNDDRLAAARVAMVVADGCRMDDAPPGLHARLEALVASRSSQDFPPQDLQKAVRDMLRSGGFRPAGRQKPASEYLAKAARDGVFPHISNAVDCNNLLSLQTGLPISLLDTESLGSAVRVRICCEGESYVFNQAGQEMDLAGLLCICDQAGRPMGNPVKDSMAAKLRPSSTRLAGFIYAPVACIGEAELAGHGQDFAAMLREYCGAAWAELVAIV